MITYLLNDEFVPRAEATLKNAQQMSGLVYLAVPKKRVRSGTGKRVVARSSTDRLEILFPMEKVIELAKESGSPEELVSVEGPISNHPRARKFSCISDRQKDWFYGKRDPRTPHATIALRRTELRHIGAWAYICSLQDKLADRGNELSPHTEARLVPFLADLHEKLSESWLSQIEFRALDAATAPATRTHEQRLTRL